MPKRRQGPGGEPGGGGGGGGGGGRRRRQRNPLYRRARRDVRVSYQPYLQDLRRSRREGIRDYEEGMARSQGAYGALQNILGPLAGQFSQQAAGIGDTFSSQLSGLTDMLGSTVPGVPQGEIGAGANLFGTIGAGALSDLASGAQRTATYQDSAQRQGAIEQMIAGRNMTKDKLDFLEELRQSRLDLKRGMGPEIRSRIDYLRDQTFQQAMATQGMNLDRRAFGLQSQQFQSGMQSDAAMRQFLMDWINSLL